MTTSAATLVGQRAGPYRLVRLLGHGGSAQVYLGTHVHLGHHVALKILRAPYENTALKQLWSEARLLPRLKHPHIVPMHGFVSNATETYLVMEYALYGTLRQRYPIGAKVPLPTIVRYVKQAAAALQYVHNHGFIHRDVKPENLLLAQDNHLLLSDFGIALATHTTKLEQDKFGTAPYTAPEQIRGRPRTASDQYSLGIVVYEWLCGYPPFEGSSQEVMYQHLHISPPALVDKVRMLPDAVEQVVMKALAKDPAQRFQSIQEFALALEWASTQRCITGHARPHGYRVSSPARQTSLSPQTRLHEPVDGKQARFSQCETR